jgi:hypothetical protein
MALKDDIKNLSRGDISYLNGFSGCGLAEESPLLYDVIILPESCTLGSSHTSSWRDTFAAALNGLNQEAFDTLAQAVWEDGSCYPKLGSPGTPVRIVRPT